MAIFCPTRRQILSAIPPLIGSTVVAPLFAHPRTRAPSFLVLGDWGRRGNANQAAVARAMGRVAQEVDSRFTITTGDNFYQSGVSSPTDSKWKDCFESVYPDAVLQRPWFPSLGNHDYYGKPDAQLAYSKINPIWNLPARFHVIRGASIGMPFVDIFVLDTSPIKYDPEHGSEQPLGGPLAPPRCELDHKKAAEQLVWLRQSLCTSTASWKLAVGHHPIYSNGDHGRQAGELRSALDGILREGGVQIYINGHDHDLQHIHVDGMDYIGSGAGSKLRRFSRPASLPGTLFASDHQPGFAVISVDPHQISVEFRGVSGEILYSNTRLRSASFQSYSSSDLVRART